MVGRALAGAAVAGLIWLGTASTAGAVTFHYNAYGGFVPDSEDGTPAFLNPDQVNENGWYAQSGPNNNAPSPEPE